MKYRIIKKTIENGNVVFTPQQKTLFGWKDIQGYYRSDFTDMPGWMTTTWNSADDAMKVILLHKKGVDVIAYQVIHEE